MATVNADVVQAFFARVGGASLQLPTRWYGRPRDNQHRLTSVAEDAEGLTLVLDERHTLGFSGDVAVLDDGESLTFSRYTTVAWRTVGWGRAGRVEEESFEGGEVRLWAPLAPGSSAR